MAPDLVQGLTLVNTVTGIRIYSTTDFRDQMNGYWLLKKDSSSWSCIKFLCAVINNVTKLLWKIYLNWYKLVFRRYKCQIQTDLFGATTEVVRDFPQVLEANTLPLARTLTSNHRLFKSHLFLFIFIYSFRENSSFWDVTPCCFKMVTTVNMCWSTRHDMPHKFSLHQQGCKLQFSHLTRYLWAEMPALDNIHVIWNLKIKTVFWPLSVFSGISRSVTSSTGIHNFHTWTVVLLYYLLQTNQKHAFRLEQASIIACTIKLWWNLYKIDGPSIIKYLHFLSIIYKLILKR